MTFNQQEYNEFLTKHNVLGFFDEEIILKSGRKSKWYANCRDLLDRVGIITELTNFILAFVEEKGLKADYFYGVPEGATKLAVILNYKKGLNDENLDQQLIIGRGKPKDHGNPKDKYFIGPVNEGDKVIIIEDVTTTGGSLLTTIKQLQEAKIEIVAAIGLVNRMEKRDDEKSVGQAVNDLNVPYYAIGNAIELLPLARDKIQPSSAVLDHVEKYFEQYGIEPLKLRGNQNVSGK